MQLNTIKTKIVTNTLFLFLIFLRIIAEIKEKKLVIHNSDTKCLII